MFKLVLLQSLSFFIILPLFSVFKKSLKLPTSTKKGCNFAFRMDNYTFLTHAPVHHVILKMAIPTIISMLSTSLYNLADTYFVGQLNTQCTAAVGISFSVMGIIQAVGFFFGHGSGNYISRKLGAKETGKAEQMASTGFFLSLLTGLLVAIVGLLFLNPLSIALGSTPTILPYTERYLGIILLGAPFMTASLTLNNQMRFQGNASYAMCGILSGVTLNVFLAPLLIFVFHLGITGAAVATLLSQTFGFIMLFLMSRRKQNIRIRMVNFTLTKPFLKEIVFGGTPSLSRQGLGCVSTIMLNVAAGGYGDAAIAGMSIVTRLSFFIYAVVIGIGQGFQPLCGFCYGAHLYSRVRDGFYFCVKLGTIFMSVFAVIGFIFSEPIIELFRSDPEVIAVGAVALDWQIISYPLIPTIVATNMMMQTIRKPIRANLVAAARSGLFFIPLIFLLPHFFGLSGVEMCQAWADVCAFLLSLPVALSGFRDMRMQKADNQLLK